MSLINIIMDYMSLAMSAFVTIFIAGAGLYFYLVKIKKVTAREEKIDYSRFIRADVNEYAKFDNIISASKGGDDERFGIVVLNDKIFISAIDIKGYNYWDASAEEQKRTIINSTVMFNTVDEEITFRQTAKAIEVEHNMQMQEDVCKEIDRKLLALTSERDDTELLLEDVKDNKEMALSVRARLDELEHVIYHTTWQKDEAYNVLRKLRQYTTTENSEKVNQLVFSYVYNPDEFTEELSTDEIYREASSALLLKASNYISALARCGCNCRLLSGIELLDLIRRHNHPFSADEIRTVDLFNEQYNTLFISSDSLLRAERKRLSDEQYEAYLEEESRRRLQRQQEYVERLEKESILMKEGIEEYVAAEAATMA